MIRVVTLSVLICRALYNLLRWIACELFWIGTRANSVSAAVTLCRLGGLSVVAGLVYFQLRGGLAAQPWMAGMQCALAALISILVGNLAKEVLLDVSARLMNYCGIDFTRRGFRIDGSAFTETLRSDGTWYRSISNATGTICEWTDTYGKCTRIITAPRTERG